MHLLSSLRMGVNLGLIRDVAIALIGITQECIAPVVFAVIAGGVGRSGRQCRDLALGAQRELELALEHVEGVRVPVMDVQFRAVLARRVAERRHDQLVELAEDSERLLRAVGDGLALAGRR